MAMKEMAPNASLAKFAAMRRASRLRYLPICFWLD